LNEDALRAIDSYPWPGNVREMENCLKRAVIMADGTRIAAGDLGIGGRRILGPRVLNLRQIRDEAERGAVIQAISESEGNIARAAELLGISRPTPLRSDAPARCELISIDL